MLGYGLSHRPRVAGGRKGHAMTDEDQLNAWMRALGDEQRRATIAYLREHRSASLDELANYLAEIASGRPGRPTPPEFDRAITRLVHVHLPLMDEADLIEWDSEEKVVTLGAVPADAPAGITR